MRARVRSAFTGLTYYIVNYTPISQKYTFRHSGVWRNDGSGRQNDGARRNNGGSGRNNNTQRIKPQVGGFDEPTDRMQLLFEVVNFLIADVGILTL